MQNRLGKKMKNQIFYDIVPLGKYYCDNFLSAFIIIQIQFIKALESFKQYLQPDLCLTLVPFDLSVLVWGVFCAYSRGDSFGLTQVLI